jgi:hypothetical protein
MYRRRDLFPANGAPATLFPRALAQATRKCLARERDFTHDDAVLFAASVANDAFASPFTPRDVLRALAEAIIDDKCAQGCVLGGLCRFQVRSGVDASGCCVIRPCFNALSLRADSEASTRRRRS